MFWKKKTDGRKTCSGNYGDELEPCPTVWIEGSPPILQRRFWDDKYAVKSNPAGPNWRYAMSSAPLPSLRVIRPSVACGDLGKIMWSASVVIVLTLHVIPALGLL